MSPNRKTYYFSFALGCPKDFNKAHKFWCGGVETGLKLMGNLKFRKHPRAKLKHVLWFGDLKALLKIPQQLLAPSKDLRSHHKNYIL